MPSACALRVMSSAKTLPRRPRYLPDHHRRIIGGASDDTPDGVVDPDGVAGAQAELGRRLGGGVRGNLERAVERACRHRDRSNRRYSVMTLVSDAGWRSASGFRGVQDRTRIAVDHDVRIARLVADGLALAGFAGLAVLAARTRVGRIARHRENGQRRGEAETPQRSPLRAPTPQTTCVPRRSCRSAFRPSTEPLVCPYRPKGRAKRRNSECPGPLFNDGAEQLPCAPAQPNNARGGQLPKR